MPDDRERCWAEFAHAASRSAAGDHEPALALVSRHPILSGELRAFVRAIQEGRVIETAKGFRVAKARPVMDRVKARPVVEDS